MKFGIPQLILILTIFMNLGISLARHGEPREDEYNFFITLLAAAIDIALLWWGGFFG